MKGGRKLKNRNHPIYRKKINKSGTVEIRFIINYSNTSEPGRVISPQFQRIDIKINYILWVPLFL